MTAASVDIAPRLECFRVSKTFGKVRVLQDVHLTVAPGEIHALVGQNGSGKSTLIKVLAGIHDPDAGGLVNVDGRPLRLPVVPRVARQSGLAFVHQSLGLIDARSVADNVRVGNALSRRWSHSIKRREEQASVAETLLRMACHIDPRALVGSLSASDRCRVAIARALVASLPGCGIIVLDEATRALPHDATQVVHETLRAVAARGGSIILVTHRLDEVVELADRVTVLRDGRVAESCLALEGVREADLAKMILGRQLSSFVRDEWVRQDEQRPRIEATEVTGTHITKASLSVAAGEIVGVSGVAGSGFEELPYLLGGGRKAVSGSLRVGERTIDLRIAGQREYFDAGVALVPENRDKLGLSLRHSIRDNVALPSMRTKGSPIWIGRAWRDADARAVIAMFDVNVRDPRALVAKLSGGNQQKVLLGKWLLTSPKLLVLHEPTQGVDVGTRQEILQRITEFARSGGSVLLATSDPDELAAICDRVLVVQDGVITAELVAPNAVDIIEVAYSESGSTVPGVTPGRTTGPP
jgi:ribose transport system ATP-binding protein